LSLVSVAMAGVTKMPVPAFLLLDGMGKVLFVGAIVALGVVFQNAIDSVLTRLASFGEFGILVIAAALALYLLFKWWRRRLFVRQLRMDRITVDELRQLIDDGAELVILDVRPKEIRELDGIIPGAVAAHPSEIGPIAAKYARDLEIVVYCACPNEESAATAAKHLKQAGFRKIRPLLGGIEAWVEAGHPTERDPLADDNEAPVVEDLVSA
jgi:rhodanese-related sulfurtransferase